MIRRQVSTVYTQAGTNYNYTCRQVLGYTCTQVHTRHDAKAKLRLMLACINNRNRNQKKTPIFPSKFGAKMSLMPNLNLL